MRIFYAQKRVLCAKSSAFFTKIFAYVNKNLFLCTRIFKEERFY